MKKLIFPLVLITSLAQAAYEDHFPAYFEYCSGTQWVLQDGQKGGTPGHGFTYVHGLCKDYDSEYPQVIPCSKVSEKNKALYPHDGVGISLDKNFTNVMWVAVPGRDLMMFGDKKPKKILNSDVEEQVQKILNWKVFSTVKSKSEMLKPYTYGTPDYLKAISKDTLGTDHAVNWARELHCVRTPFPQKKLKDMAKFLNDSNNQYRSGPEYQWSKLSNNCVHLSINQSHSVGISKSIKVDQKFIQLLTNMALPANGFLMYADNMVLKRTPSKRTLNKSLVKKDFHEVQVGALISHYKAFPTGDHFITDNLSVLTAPRILKPWKLLATPKKYGKKHMTPQNSNLKANAEMWLERYEKLFSKLDKSEAAGKLGDYLRQQIALSQKIIEEE